MIDINSNVKVSRVRNMSKSLRNYMNAGKKKDDYNIKNHAKYAVLEIIANVVLPSKSSHSSELF